MNILFFNEHRPLKSDGGVQRVTTVLSEYFEDNGFKIFFVFLKAKKSEEKLLDNEFELLEEKIFSKRNIEDLLHIQKRIHFHLIINQMGFNRGVIKLLSKVFVPIWTCLHSSPDFQITYSHLLLETDSIKIDSANNLKFYFKKIYQFFLKHKIRINLKSIYLYSNYTILLSHDFIPIFKNLTRINDLKKLLIIPNPIDPTFYLESKINLFQKKKEIIFVGRFQNGKRIHLLLEIWLELFSSFPDWTFKLVGAGPNYNYIRSLSKSLGLKNIIFIGKSDNVLCHYNTASIFISASAFEGFPLTVVEAQACGVVPIIYGSYASVNNVVLNNKSGYIISDLNKQDFIYKLKHLMSNSSELNLMSQYARKFSFNFKVKRIGSIWLNHFKMIQNK